MSIELKPCPFCGGEATMSSYTYSLSGLGTQYKVECEGHDCPAQPTVDWHYWTAEEAAEAWNTRAERTCRIVKKWSDSDYVDGWRYRCSECMCFIPVNERDPETGDVISAANYCPNCGAKVVDE